MIIIILLLFLLLLLLLLYKFISHPPRDLLFFKYICCFYDAVQKYYAINILVLDFSAFRTPVCIPVQSLRILLPLSDRL